MVVPSPARQVARRLEELRAHGPQALTAVPDEATWPALSEDERRRRLHELRLDLYGLSALLAHAVVGCAVANRPSYPPYGLARSRFSEWRLITGDPDPYEEGSVDSFFTLWAAIVDTVVFHLHGEITGRRQSPHAWTVTSLERLLPVLGAVDDAGGQARKRDALTFMYGGLQFGSSVCVQLVEAQARALGRDAPELSGEERAAVIERSTGPAYRLAALEFTQGLSAYRELLSTADDTPSQGRETPGWLDADRFVVQRAEGQPWRVVLTEAERPASGLDEARLGCPARIAVDDGDTPIGVLWEWCVEIAAAAGLLEPSGRAA